MVNMTLSPSISRKNFQVQMSHIDNPTVINRHKHKPVISCIAESVIMALLSRSIWKTSVSTRRWY